MCNVRVFRGVRHEATEILVKLIQYRGSNSDRLTW
jgi:hypothetical protein